MTRKDGSESRNKPPKPSSTPVSKVHILNPSAHNVDGGVAINGVHTG